MQKLSHYSKINFIACDFSTLYVEKKKSMVKYQVSMSGCEEKIGFSLLSSSYLLRALRYS